MLELWGSPSSDHPHYIRFRHQLFIVLAPRGSLVLGRQQPPRLGQDHPREAPPATDPAAGRNPWRAAKSDARSRVRLSSQAWFLRRQVLVGKVVKVVAPYRPAHCVELAFDHLVAPDLVEPVKGAGELKDAGGSSR
jgi:hypothetical protein